jgi:putative flippase GtrA
MDEDDHKHSALRYAALAASILCINSLILYVLSNLIGITPLLAKLGTELVMFFFSFFMQKHFVFKKQPVAEKKTQPPFQNAAAA